MGRKRKHNCYIVDTDADRMMPKWLSARINDRNIGLLYHIRDGTACLKGVKINHEFAEIGDVVILNGTKLSVERKGR